MERFLTRRELMGGILGLGGLWASTRILPNAPGVMATPEFPPRRIVHLSDFHWGYQGDANRNVRASLDRVLALVKRINPLPELLLVTGDLIEATADGKERERRFLAVKMRLDALGIPWIAIPGEHDTFGDAGRMYRQVIGPLHFYRKICGVQIVGLDNVSRGFFLGRDQVEWLHQVLRGHSPAEPLFILSHAPLYDLFTPWNWYTLDGQAVFEAISRVPGRHLLYGHVHQIIDQEHSGSMSRSGLPTSWPLPEPGPMVQLSPWPQGASHPDMGLGFRVIDMRGQNLTIHSIMLGKTWDKAGVL